MTEYWIEKFNKWKKNNTLLRITILKEKKLPSIVMCRVLQIDSNNMSILIYNVDKKNVENISLYKLDSIEEFP